MRDDRRESFLWSVVEFGDVNDVDVPELNGCYLQYTKRLCQQKNNTTVCDHYHFDIFNAVIDFQLMELNDRFSDNAMELLTLSHVALSHVDKFKSFSPDAIYSLVNKFYYQDFTKEEREDLERQLDHYRFDVVRDSQFHKLGFLHKLCQELAARKKANIYPLFDMLIRLVLNLPVSIVTTERAFSELKFIKTPVRNTMANEFLTNAMIIYIERKIALGVDIGFIIIDKFDIKKNRRLRLK